MFTGIIEEIGTINSKTKKNNAIYWSIKTSPAFMQDVNIGDSISVEGVCQTVTSFHKDSFYFYSSPTTLNITTLEQFPLNSFVNLEKALLLNKRLGGHLVYGHIEEKAKIHTIVKHHETYALTIKISEKLKPLIIEKGSICINGVSLTVSEYMFPYFTVTVIPHTWLYTTLQYSKINDWVNLETDIIGKYVLGLYNNSSSHSDVRLKETLKQSGFIK